jgi:hypothetical protein
LAVQEGSGLAAETINDMAIVDATGSADFLVTGHMHSGQLQDLSHADETDNVVVVEMQGKALSY